MLGKRKSDSRSTSNTSTRYKSETISSPSLSLKQIKSALQTLLAQLAAIEREYVLLERIWYKNSAQFRSAYWWMAFDSARRPLKRLFSIADAAIEKSQAQKITHSCVQAYSQLLAPALPPATTPSTHTQLPWPTIPKYSIKSDLFDAELAINTLQLLSTLEKSLRNIAKRCVQAGRMLSLHLNTPPAPTFAPLVTALIALLASVHSSATSLFGDDSTKRAPLSLLTLAFTDPPRHDVAK